ncbi:MAG: protein kinase, partial [Planctomycetota bacterium JB042]
AFDELLGPAEGGDPLGPLESASRPVAPTLAPGTRLGGYRVIGPLGRGGMGVVHEATHEATRRRVAIKVLRPSDDPPETRALLLRREATALARLRHPGIATLHDARLDGETGFVVMELVDGRPIDEACDAAGWSTPERVRLLIDLCDAVVYAHDRGVIHRDLKPANVLVDADERVRILDFGLARLAHREDERSLPTLGSSTPGTPEYMSPEQVSAPDEVDVRSDVYSLGVLMYEVLLGRLPYPVPRGSALAAARAIAEAEPTRPRRVDPAFPRDLEAILTKALEKSPDRRYASARALADDLRRFAEDRPVEARELTPLVALARLARRRKGLFAAAAVSTLAVTVGAVASSVGLLRARAAERAAREEAAVARAVSRFQEHLLSGANPDLADRPGLTVRELLDRASPRVASMFSDSARAEAEVRTILGRAYNAMGSFSEALPHLERAVDLRRRDDDRGALADAQRNLAVLLHGMERFEGAESLHAEALAIRRARLGDRHEKTLQSRIEIAALLRDRGRLDEALAQLSAAVEACVPDGPRPADRLAEALLDAATCETLRGRREAALERLVDSWARVGAEAAPLDRRVTVRCRRSALLSMLRRDREADTELDAAAALARDLGSLDDRTRISVHREIAEALVRRERADEAVPHLEAARNLHEARFGPDLALTLRLSFQLGEALSRAGELDRAGDALLATLHRQEELLGRRSSDAIRTRLALGDHLERSGDPAGARRVLAECIDEDSAHPLTRAVAIRAWIRIGRAHLREEAPAEACAAFASALARIEAPPASSELRSTVEPWLEFATLLVDRPDLRGRPLPETGEELLEFLRSARSEDPEAETVRDGEAER